MSIREIAYQNIMSDAYGKEPGILLPYLDYLYEVQELEKGTAYNYYMTMRSLAKFLKHRRKHMECEPNEVVMNRVTQAEMASITEEEWEDYLDHYELVVKESQGCLAVRISIVRGFYRWLALEHNESIPPFIEAADRPRVMRQDYTMVTEQMEATICKHLHGKFALRNICIVRMFLRCALGLQEICELRLEDVALHQLTVSDRTGKKRVVPLDDETRKAIGAYLSVRDPSIDGKNTFFVSRKRKRMRRGAVEKMLRNAVSLAGPSLSDVSIRDLQLTAKARMVANVGLDEAGPMTNIGSPHYFRKVYAGYQQKVAQN